MPLVGQAEPRYATPNQATLRHAKPSHATFSRGHIFAKSTRNETRFPYFAQERNRPTRTRHILSVIFGGHMYLCYRTVDEVRQKFYFSMDFHIEPMINKSAMKGLFTPGYIVRRN